MMETKEKVQILAERFMETGALVNPGDTIRLTYRDGVSGKEEVLDFEVTEEAYYDYMAVVGFTPEQLEELGLPFLSKAVCGLFGQVRED